MTRAPVECAHLRDWILRWIEANGATPEWQDAAHLELRRRATVGADDDNKGPWPTAAVRGRQ